MSDTNTEIGAEIGTDAVPEPRPAAERQVEVRRNIGLAVAVGGLAAVLTVAFAVRGFNGGTGLDWLSFAVLAMVTIAHIASLADSRAPLLVADAHGVRLRKGSVWRGIAWPEIDCLEHLPRRGLLRDGHILVDGYDEQQLLVPLTLATRVVGATGQDLSDVLAELAGGRAEVVEVVPGLDEEPRPDTAHAEASATTDADEQPDAGDRYYGDEQPDPQPELGEQLHADGADTDEIEAIDEPIAPAPLPERAMVLPARVEMATARGEFDADDQPTDEQPAIERETTPVETGTVVLDDLAVRPAALPVVGPPLVAARERLRLTIDQLSERTRIRPHVIEAIEVDDFGPCGGDFYARGHLRTLARVLGVDAAPLVTSYDELYAHEPVDPRRVFESELATGTGGAIRSTRGGRNWSVLIAAVMGAVLIWSVARLVLDSGEPVSNTPVLNQSGGITKASASKGDPIKLTLTAAAGGAEVNVRDAAGQIVFDGNLAFGQTTVLKVVAPVRIFSSDGSVTYAVGKKDARALGETGSETSKTIVAR